MIDAKKARELSDSTIGELAEKELRNIETAINNAIRKGDSTVSFISLSKKTKTELEKLGYKVNYFYDQRDSYGEYTISW